MTRVQALWLVAWLVQLACGGAAPAPAPVSNRTTRAPVQPAPILVRLCPIVQTANGDDIDDGGVAVEIVADPSRPPRRIARIVGGCHKVALLRDREVARAECRDPHVEETHVVSVMRQNGHTLMIDVFSVD